MGIAFSMNRIAQESQERGVGADKIRLFFYKKLSFNSMNPNGTNPALTTVLSE